MASAVDAPINHHGQIHAKNLAFKVDPSEDTADLHRAMDVFNKKRCVTDMCAMQDGRYLIYCPSILHLSTGMAAMATALSTKLPITRIPVDRVSRVLRDFFPEGYESLDVRVIFGTRFTKDAINKVVKAQTQGQKNKKIMEAPSIRSLVDSGVIALNTAASTSSNKDFVEREDKNRAISMRPVLDGEITLQFYNYNNAGEIVPGTPMTEVNFKGRPGNTLTKKKHLWLYSKKSGYGKTTTMRVNLVERYKGFIIRDLKNAMGIPKDMQFLILDEYGGSNTLPIETLKNVTNGDASNASLTRKSHGESYYPAKDAQIIILSNKSPYEVYGAWDKRSQTRVMSEDVWSTIDSRFQVYRLDGDDEDEKIEFMDPRIMTDNQLEKKLLSVVASNGVGTTADYYENLLSEVHAVLKAKNPRINVISRENAVQIMERVAPFNKEEMVMEEEVPVAEDAPHAELNADLKKMKSHVIPTCQNLSWRYILSKLCVVDTFRLKVGKEKYMAMAAINTEVKRLQNNKYINGPHYTSEDIMASMMKMVDTDCEDGQEDRVRRTEEFREMLLANPMKIDGLRAALKRRQEEEFFEEIADTPTKRSRSVSM